MNDPIQQHKPPQYLIRIPTNSTDQCYDEADTPEEAMEKAREIAVEAPDAVIDVYHHAVTVRLRPEPPAEPT